MAGQHLRRAGRQRGVVPGRVQLRRGHHGRRGARQQDRQVRGRGAARLHPRQRAQSRALQCWWLRAGFQVEYSEGHHLSVSIQKRFVFAAAKLFSPSCHS